MLKTISIIATLAGALSGRNAERLIARYVQQTRHYQNLTSHARPASEAR